MYLVIAVPRNGRHGLYRQENKKQITPSLELQAPTLFLQVLLQIGL
jgi:hypothetical protein